MTVLDRLASLIDLGLLLVLDLLGRGAGAGRPVVRDGIAVVVGALGRRVVVLVVVILGGALSLAFARGRSLGGLGSASGAAAFLAAGRRGGAGTGGDAGGIGTLGVTLLELFENLLGPLLRCGKSKRGNRQPLR